MPLPDEVRLRHIRDAARDAIKFVEGKSRADLESNEMLALALVRLLEIRGRAKITSHFPAGSFGRGHRCSLLTDPRVGYARRSRLAGGQNSRAVKYEFIFARPLIGEAANGVSPELRAKHPHNPLDGYVRDAK
jgi:uncharacterized protein with HEPN domain